MLVITYCSTQYVGPLNAPSRVELLGAFLCFKVQRMTEGFFTGSYPPSLAVASDFDSEGQ